VAERIRAGFAGEGATKERASLAEIQRAQEARAQQLGGGGGGGASAEAASRNAWGLKAVLNAEQRRGGKEEAKGGAAKRQ
jgi:hypothetical protein